MITNRTKSNEKMEINQRKREGIIPLEGKLPYEPPKIMVQQVELENPIMIASVHPTDVQGNVKVNSWNQQQSQSADYWQGGASFWQ